MLASTSRWLEGDGWAFEPKFDGWRALVHVDARGFTVYSRPGRDLTSSVPHLAPLAETVPTETVLDGELVAGSGRAASFYRLAPELAARRERVTFVAFDVLALDGRSVISLPTRSAAGSWLTSLSPARTGARRVSGPTSRSRTFWQPVSFKASRGW